jgi:adenosylhomocysteine nucleosidase
MNTAQPIGLISAIAEETAILRGRLLDGGVETHAGVRFQPGRLDGRPAVLVETGIGKVNAALVATVLLERFGVGAFLFAGVAGGLDPDLGIGDVVVAERLIQHDYGAIVDGRLRPYRPGALPFGVPVAPLDFVPPAGVLEGAKAALAALVLPEMPAAATGAAARRPRLRFGTVLTGDQFLACEETRARLFDEHRALAIEMEGAAVAQVAEAYGKPWIVVRAISDLAGRESQRDFTAFVEAAAAGTADVVTRLLPILTR